MPDNLVPIDPGDQSSTTTTETNTVSRPGTTLPDWHISISFGKSNSKNFPQAVALAKMAPQYFEQTVDKNILHQAVYSDQPDQYLQFIKLYELIQNWKSCFVVINGQLVDRKIVGGLNYCYGDKCRSGNPSFCYGASMFTENPFGCHRLQASAWNNPWWSFGIFDTQGIWHVDKNAILERITEYSQPYRLCPAFSWEKALDGLKKLPNTINPKRNPEWVASGSGIMPKSRTEPVVAASLTIDVSDLLRSNYAEEEASKESPFSSRQKQKPAGCGCLGCLLPVLGIAGVAAFILIMLW
jgi:hypothetical protein